MTSTCAVLPLALALLLPAHSLAQGPQLLADVQVTPELEPWSYPRDLTPFGAGVLFAATREDVGEELWFSDGTTSGTRLVAEVRPGTADGYWGPIVVAGPLAFFAADDGIRGAELWCTDGTRAGTRLVLDVAPGAGGSNLRELTAVGSTLFFLADDGVHGFELWRSDGSVAGTWLVTDLLPGPGHGVLSEVVGLSGGVVFAGDDGVNGTEPWYSDGTLAGTTLLLDIAAGPASSSPGSLTVINGRVWFRADDGISGSEPWTTDGTPTSIAMLTDLRPGAASSRPTSFCALGNAVVFAAYDGPLMELWRADAQGVALVSGITGADPDQFRSTGSRVYFPVVNGLSTRVWSSDGTTGGTAPISGANHTAARQLAVNGDVLWFAGTDPVHGEEPWTARSGVGAMVADVRPGVLDSQPGGFAPFPGTNRMVFAATDPPIGREPWTSDGTPGNTRLLSNVNPRRPGATLGSAPYGLVDAAGTAYFVADDGVHGPELWKSDGTNAGTALVADLDPDPTPSLPPRVLAAIGDTVYFAADDGIHGQELWRANGSSLAMVADIRPGASSSVPWSACAIGARLFFTASDGIAGEELWVTDGSTANTRLVADLRPGGENSYVHSLRNASGTLFFFADAQGGPEDELWRSDGTAAGTTLVRDFANGPVVEGGGLQMVAIGSRIVFTAGTYSNRELWVSDGTPANTFWLADLGIDRRYDGPELVSAEGRAWFVADDGVHGVELWSSDGTISGTRLVADIAPGATSSWPEFLATGAGVLWFAAQDPALGVEPFVSDGTAGGTRMVGDLVPGYGSSAPMNFAAVGTRRVLFRAGSPSTGPELLVSDGSAVGTLAFDIRPDHHGSLPGSFVLSAGRVIFFADDGMHGQEPWVIEPGATSQSIGLRCTRGGVAPRLGATDPVLGGSTRITATNGPAATAGFLILGLRDGAPIGILGCTVLVGTPLAWVPLAIPTSQGDLAIPSDPSLAGALIAIQAWYFPTDGSLTPSASNGVYLTLGN
ncbi:MAG: hypothetical protein HZB39_13800 [Planctomycetes bacterium]|nr:hypothetical protein [Planctomycetota bacterium]